MNPANTSTTKTTTIVAFERPVPSCHRGVWGLLALAVAMPPKWSRQKPVTLSGNASVNRILLGA